MLHDDSSSSDGEDRGQPQRRLRTPQPRRVAKRGPSRRPPATADGTRRGRRRHQRSGGAGGAGANGAVETRSGAAMFARDRGTGGVAPPAGVAVGERAASGSRSGSRSASAAVVDPAQVIADEGDGPVAREGRTQGEAGGVAATAAAAAMWRGNGGGERKQDGDRRAQLRRRFTVAAKAATAAVGIKQTTWEHGAGYASGHHPSIMASLAAHADELARPIATGPWRDGMTRVLDDNLLYENLVLRAAAFSFCDCGCQYCSSRQVYYSKVCTCKTARCPGRFQWLLNQPLRAPDNPGMALRLHSQSQAVSVDKLWGYIARSEPLTTTSFFMRSLVTWSERASGAQPLPDLHSDMTTMFAGSDGEWMTRDTEPCWTVASALLWLPTLGVVMDGINLLRKWRAWHPARCTATTGTAVSHGLGRANRGAGGAVLADDPLVLSPNQYLWMKNPAIANAVGATLFDSDKLLFHIHIHRHLDLSGPWRAAMLQLPPDDAVPVHARTPEAGADVRRHIRGRAGAWCVRFIIFLAAWLLVALAATQWDLDDADASGALGATLASSLVVLVGIVLLRALFSLVRQTQVIDGYTSLRLAMWHAWRGEYGAWVLAVYRLLSKRAAPGFQWLHLSSSSDPTFTSLPLCEPPYTALLLGNTAASVVSATAPRVAVRDGRPVVAARPEELDTFKSQVLTAMREESAVAASEAQMLGIRPNHAQAPHEKFMPRPERGVPLGLGIGDSLRADDGGLSGRALGQRRRSSRGLCSTPARYRRIVRLLIALPIAVLHGFIPALFAYERDNNSFNTSCAVGASSHVFGGCRGDIAVAIALSSLFAWYFVDQLLLVVLDLAYSENLMALFTSMLELPADAPDPHRPFVPAPNFALSTRADVSRWLAVRDLVQHKTLFPAGPQRSWARSQASLTIAVLAVFTAGVYMAMRIAWRTWSWTPWHAVTVFDAVVLAALCSFSLKSMAAVNAGRVEQIDLAAQRRVQINLRVRQHQAAVAGLHTRFDADGEAHWPGQDRSIQAAHEIQELQHTADLIESVVEVLPDASDKQYVLTLMWLPITRKIAVLFVVVAVTIWVALMLATVVVE